MEWLCVRGFAQKLRRVDVARARRTEHLGDWRLVKDNTVRTVLRLPDPESPEGPGLFLKRYKFRDLGRSVRHLAVPTKPQVEWRACRALQAIGVPTCDVLAIGLRRRWGVPQEGFLISREIAEVTSLDRFLRQQSHPHSILPVARELARLTASLLRNGLFHNDYHSGNLLVRADAADGQRVFIVDLHSFRRRHIGRRHATAMLAKLACSTDASALNPRVKACFLEHLLHNWRGLDEVYAPDVQRWSCRVRREMERQHRRHMRSRTRRCLKESSLFTGEKTESFTVRRRRDFPLEAALAAVALHRKAVDGEADGVQVRGEARRTEVTVCPSESVPPRTKNKPAPAAEVLPGKVCVKAFRRVTLRERLKDSLRPRSRARVAWVAARGMHVRDIPAPQPLALLESRRKLSGEPDYLIAEAIEHEGSLTEFLMRAEPPERQLRRLSDTVARLLVHMAEEGVYHPDTKPANILVRREEDGFPLCLVDLDRVRFDARMWRGRWVKVLARVNAGLPEGISVLHRMRCLRGCAAGRWSAAKRLKITRNVQGLSRTRGRPDLPE
mgnify:FL=1